MRSVVQCGTAESSRDSRANWPRQEEVAQVNPSFCCALRFLIERFWHMSAARAGVKNRPTSPPRGDVADVLGASAEDPDSSDFSVAVSVTGLCRNIVKRRLVNAL